MVLNRTKQIRSALVLVTQLVINASKPTLSSNFDVRGHVLKSKTPRLAVPLAPHPLILSMRLLGDM